MSWRTIRKSTVEDEQRLRVAAERFCTKYMPNYLRSDDPVFDAECYVSDRETPDGYKHPVARRAWFAAVRRALRDSAATGIAYGYVGASPK